MIQPGKVIESANLQTGNDDLWTSRKTSELSPMDGT